MKALRFLQLGPLGVKIVKESLVGGVGSGVKIVDDAQLFFNFALRDVGGLGELSRMLHTILDRNYNIAVDEWLFAGDILLIGERQNLASFEPAVTHYLRKM